MAKAPRTRTTLTAVAEQAGVSIASASRVLNGLPASDDVSRRVRAAADDLRYVPDSTARSLQRGRTDQIAFAVADVGNPVYVSMMHAVNAVVSESGFRLVISSTGNDPAEQLELLGGLGRGFVDGMVLSPLRVTGEIVEALRETRRPVAVIGTVPDDLDVDSVRADSVRGVGLAVAHLAAQGRTRVAFLNGSLDTVPGSTRLAGYLVAMAEHGLPTSGDLQVEAADFTYRAGLAATGVLLDQASPDALICANDLLAVAAMRVLTDRGLCVPQDVALVGMDNTDVTGLVTPTLSSVDLGAAERARRAAQLLVERLADPDAPRQRVTVSPRLTVRGSSAPSELAEPRTKT